MSTLTYRNTELDELVICMTTLAAFKGDPYTTPFGLSSLIAGGKAVMASNPPLDVNAIKYENMQPAPYTYKTLLERTGQTISTKGSDRVVFAWTPEAFSNAAVDRVVGCVRLEDLALAHAAIAAYRERGIPPDRIVVAGKASALPDEEYDKLTATGVLLEEMDWERYGDAGQSRLERTLEPFYRTLLRVGPVIEDVTSRPYTYTPSPTQASQQDMHRLGELLRGDDDMFD